MNCGTVMAAIQNKSHIFIGIMDRECEAAFAEDTYSFVVLVNLWKNTWVICVNIYNSVCPLWREEPSQQWQPRAVPEFHFGHGGSSLHSFSQSSVAQPLQAGLHDRQVADFLSRHTKRSPEQTREICFFIFALIAIELIWVGVSLGGVLKTSLSLTQDCSIFSKQQEGWNRNYHYLTCRAQIVVKISLELKAILAN